VDKLARPASKDSLRIAAHVSYFHVPSRLRFLEKTIESLNSIGPFVDIYIHTNSVLDDLADRRQSLKIISYPYRSQSWTVFAEKIWQKLGLATKGYKWNHFRRFEWSLCCGLGLRRLANPYYLTWESRRVMRKILDLYDVQIYLEDDIIFNGQNLQYWLDYAPTCLSNGFNLGFIRYEYNQKKNTKYATDLFALPNEILEIDSKPFLVNNVNPYCGMWIYHKSELAKFMSSSEWNFKFSGLGIREMAAIGWHYPMMKRFKATVIPLKPVYSQRLSTVSGAEIHHYPNNYINHPMFCQYEIPLVLTQHS
jgi:hypothetical protein